MCKTIFIKTSRTAITKVIAKYGKFLKILSNQSFYFFDNKTKRLLNIRKLQFEIFINEYFGVNSAKNEYK